MTHAHRYTTTIPLVPAEVWDDVLIRAALLVIFHQQQQRPA